MDSSLLRNKLHTIIDSVQDSDTLQLFMEVFTGYLKDAEEGDIIDSLTKKQKARLDASIEQSQQGKTISDATMREEIRQWLTK